jgi:hypothetical protein
MTLASLRSRIALVAAVLLTLADCRAADLSAPSGRFSPDELSADRDDAQRGSGRRAPQPIGCQAGEALTASARIGPRGGVLRIGSSSLIVPHGALRSSVRISAMRRPDASGTIDFQPDGLRFQRPVRLVLSASACETPSVGMAAVVHLGATGEILETIAASFDRRWNEVAAPITHFSGYAIAF